MSTHFHSPGDLKVLLQSRQVKDARQRDECWSSFGFLTTSAGRRSSAWLVGRDAMGKGRTRTRVALEGDHCGQVKDSESWLSRERERALRGRVRRQTRSSDGGLRRRPPDENRRRDVGTSPVPPSRLREYQCARLPPRERVSIGRGCECRNGPAIGAGNRAGTEMGYRQM